MIGGDDQAVAPLRVAVLVSGRGSNLQALLDARAVSTLPIDVVAVASNRPACAALDLARAAGIETLAFDQRDFATRAALDDALSAALAGLRPELVVLAGFMRILATPVVEAWAGRMINIHPSLLPRHPGLDTHARVLAAAESEHGASVHFVIPALDAGPVLAQARIEVRPGDTPAVLAQRLLPREHALLVACVRLFAQRRVALTPAGIQLDGNTLARPLQLDSTHALVPTDDRSADPGP